MKKKNIILKWLDNRQLNKEESQVFEQLDTFDSYVKISEAAKNFKAPDYHLDENLKNLKSALSNNDKVTNKFSFISILLRIAAVFVIGIGVYYAFFNTPNLTVIASANKKTSFELPDSSVVSLNTQSSLTYAKKNWVNERKVDLTGEAYFKVASGKKFDVQTSTGTISVLGTQFNIKERDHFFEVSCYEGSVKVVYNKSSRILKPGDVFTVINKEVSQTKLSSRLPDWKENKSSFKSLPYQYIIKEFERQYDVNISTKNIDLTTLFTGSFIHTDIETALQSITIPMRLHYTIDAKKITLYRE